MNKFIFIFYDMNSFNELSESTAFTLIFLLFYVSTEADMEWLKKLEIINREELLHHFTIERMLNNICSE